MGHTVNIIFTRFLKLFEIQVCFAHFRFFEICTDVMRTVLTMAKRFESIISDIVPTVYTKLNEFGSFPKCQFLLHILGLSKFVLR